MTALVIPFREVDNSLADALAERGVAFPMGGFAPGLYVQTCQKCGKRHMADKHAISCLPCAVANAIDVGLRACASQTKAFYRGRQSGLDDVARFLAAGAQAWRYSPPAAMTREQREDVKRQARDADRRAADPEGAAEVDDLVERTRQVQERIAAERRAAEGLDPDPDGDAA